MDLRAHKRDLLARRGGSSPLPASRRRARFAHDQHPQEGLVLPCGMRRREALGTRQQVRLAVAFRGSVWEKRRQTATDLLRVSGCCGQGDLPQETLLHRRAQVLCDGAPEERPVRQGQGRKTATVSPARATCGPRPGQVRLCDRGRERRRNSSVVDAGGHDERHGRRGGQVEERAQPVLPERRQSLPPGGR